MSNAVTVSTFNGQIPVRRPIKDWHLDTEKGFIFGNFVPFEFNFPLFEKGHILGFTENVVIARSRCRIYAFVLNGLNPCFADKKAEYLAFLQTKQLEPQVIF